jgi:biopolymer transport protein ExbD
MNLRGRNKVSAEFNMSSMTDMFSYYYILYANINHGNHQCFRLGAAKSKGKQTIKISQSASIKLQFF